MEIYIVRPGDTLSAIARQFGVPLSQLMSDNRISDPLRLVAGQALVVRFPEQSYTVRPGDTADSVARRFGISLRQLYRNNPVLEGQPQLWPDQTLVISYRRTGGPAVEANGYAYPFIDQALLQRTLPFLTYLTPFTYGIQPDGSLVELEDGGLLSAARQAGSGALMHLSTLTDEGGFSNDLAHLVLTDAAVQDRLVEALVANLQAKGYRGLDVDFEYVFPEDGPAYAAFIARLRARLAPLGLLLVVALAPKTSADQSGLLYEAHNYRALGAAADRAFLMTYEWGYAYSEPMAVAPLPNVRRVVEYALTEIPAQKLWLGMPNYGYDWPLPYRQGETRATSISPQYGVSLALRYGAVIRYDERAQAPWFRYTDDSGTQHEVWFEDARSARAKLALIGEYGLRGVGYWSLMRPFPQTWLVLDDLYTILDP